MRTNPSNHDVVKQIDDVGQCILENDRKGNGGCGPIERPGAEKRIPEGDADPDGFLAGEG